MRVVYLHQYFNTPRMAGSTRSYEMARRLTEWGHDVHMVTSWREPARTTDWFTTTEAGIQVHWLPVPYSNHMSYAERIRAFSRFAFHAARRALSLPADVVFASSTPLTIALPGVYAARPRRVPMVFEVRDLWPQVPIAMGALRNPLARCVARALERFAYRNATRVVALSPGMAEGVVSTGYPAEHVVTIPNSADLELFRPDESRARSFRQRHPELGSGKIVLYAGTLGLANGVDYLVHVAARYRELNAGTRFVTIGSGAKEMEIAELARQMGVFSQNFFMYPPTSKHELVEAFAAAAVTTSLFVDIPELEANSANKFFDGLSSGTAVAINYGGWQAELVGKYGVGVVLSREPAVAARQLSGLLEDEARLSECGRRARKLAEERFSRDVLARQLESVLIDAVSTGRSR